MSGMSRPARGASSLRLRASAAVKEDPNAPVGGGLMGAVPAPSGLLGTLGLSDRDAPDASGGALKLTQEGIQERLPAMPGMRRQRATGASARPIQERVLPMGRPPQPPVPGEAPPEPPPSPPGVMPSPSKSKAAPSKGSSTSLVPSSDAVVSGAAFQTRLQANARVLPKGAAEEEVKDTGSETWDDRPAREIMWGIAREHTLFAVVTAFLVGDGPRVSTTPQAVQLLCGTAVGLLFLSCAQLRYMWLGAGASWAPSPPAYEQGEPGSLSDRLTFLSGVAGAAALVCWPCVLVARWLFLLINQKFWRTTPRRTKAVFTATWTGVISTCLALGIGAISISSNMDAPIVEVDVMLSWLLAMLVQWLLYEPAMLLLYTAFTLLLKWCTSFEDLPEVKAETVKQQILQEKLRKEQMKPTQGTKGA